MKSGCTHGYWVQFPVHCSAFRQQNRDDFSPISLDKTQRFRLFQTTRKRIQILAQCTVQLLWSQPSFKPKQFTNKKWSSIATWWTIPDNEDVIQSYSHWKWVLTYPVLEPGRPPCGSTMGRNYSDVLSFLDASEYLILQQRLQDVLIRGSESRQHSLLLVVSHNGVGNERIDSTALVSSITKKNHDEEMNSDVGDSKE